MHCIDCRYSDVIHVSNGGYHSICTKAESPNFLKIIDIFFCCCDEGEMEDDAECPTEIP